MAWTESHQSLLNHRKTLRFARELGIDQVAAIGHLHIFWWWAMDNAPDGNLTKIDPTDIGIAAQYHANDAGPETSRTTFFDALVAAQFVDRKSHGNDRPPSFQIHDWEQYGGKLCKTRATNRNRMKVARATLEESRGEKSRGDQISTPCSPPKRGPPQRKTRRNNRPLSGKYRDKVIHG